MPTRRHLPDHQGQPLGRRILRSGTRRRHRLQHLSTRRAGPPLGPKSAQSRPRQHRRGARSRAHQYIYSLSTDGTAATSSAKTPRQHNARRQPALRHPPSPPRPRRRRPMTAFITRLALVPPKPKLLFSTALHLALLGLERHEVDAFCPLVRIVEVERRRHDLVADREDAEDRSPPRPRRPADGRSPTWCCSSTRRPDRRRTRAWPRPARSCRPSSRCRGR